MLANLFGLIRLPNLLLMAFMHTIIRFGLIEPFYYRIGPKAPLSWKIFYILSAILILIAAGGYVVNDIFDRHIDKINKPDKRIVGAKISIGLSWVIYILLNGMAMVLTWLFFNQWEYYLTHSTAILLLLIYSISVKRKGLIGNVLVAILCTVVVLEVVYEDLTHLWHHSQVLGNTDAILRLTIIIVYSSFAFLSTLSRELTKDLEDQKGDSEFGRRTLPVVWGVAKTKVTIIVLNVLLLAILAYEIYLFVPYSNFVAITYIAVFLVLPMLYICYRLARAKEQGHYHQLSQQWKVYMLLGIFFLMIYDLNLV